MRNLFAMLVFVFFAVNASGQEASKMVQTRLNPILETVEVNDDEKQALIAAIEKFQKNARQIRKNGGDNMKAELKKNNQHYLDEVKETLGDERFTKWRQEVKKQNAAKRAQQ